MALHAKGPGAARAKLAAIVSAVFLLSMGRTAGAAQQEPNSLPRTVRIGVFSLFKPKMLRLMPASNLLDGDAGGPMFLEMDGNERVLPVGSQAVVEMESKGEIRVTAPNWQSVGGGLRALQSQRNRAGAGAFWLEVPGKLRRRYAGSLEIRSDGQSLEAIVTMPLEIAVASVVQAESPPEAPMEALKAQAIAARSFLVARQTGHVAFDFCDTTHCQFLRSPPAKDSPAANATKATESLMLTWHDDVAAEDRTLAAMYARSCGGRTRTLRDIGFGSTGYPYYSVRCAYCRRHPELWQRNNAVKDGAFTERERLAFNRIHGWSAIPSLPQAPDETKADPMAGRGVGHGVGLCQLGAADMARRGAGYSEILAHYYPNTKVASLQTQ